ncbi:hypothetical protein M422DRAFT_265718 [Sphaerobolus stellatus SS14]|uniref:Potassium channel domain-containing protein n=1 Tax=Sphaerobolus stellatus (strain SS14) TaxID=990650 RepID=A0A0C9V4L8_SPHS4|nr:hypothetical protein M422DRAFT_265718 [Sphaerobolus stellatus SS14]
MQLSKDQWKKLHSWAMVSPLLGAILAPFSTLFDIPALTEPWFIRFDPTVLLDPNKADSIPDKHENVALSVVGLAFNIIANVLLVVRFSSSLKWWRTATRLSVVSWIIKVVVALINLAVFGRVPPNAVHGEGFWCALISLLICVIITFLLIFHWILEARNQPLHNTPTDDQLSLRVAGRHFMNNVTLFIIDLAVFALLSSHFEHWTYLQGIYYSIVTSLTVGFGDFRPHTAVIRVLAFFFSVIAMAQLGNIIGMLIRFFTSRSQEKKAHSRIKYEQKRHEEELEKHIKAIRTTSSRNIRKSDSIDSGDMKTEKKQRLPVPDLHQEIEFLHRLAEEQESKARMWDMISSSAGLLVFWFVGAAIFSQLEGWGYGTGMYFTYVAFLTIGYGDFTPITPAGRVVFVLYSILAVPIMASFAVNAVQQSFGSI